MAITADKIGASVNNGRRHPLQGMDTLVYFQDQATGTLLTLGEFTGFQYTIRNATEPYLPLGQRTLSLLDGEYQIGWVAEQGKINLDSLEQILGYKYIGPAITIGRSPRYQIVVEYNAKEYDETYLSLSPVTNVFQNQELSNEAGNPEPNRADQYVRRAQGRYVFTFCKVDAFTSGAMAGRSVIADRIEGLAEGMYIEPLDNGKIPGGGVRQVQGLPIGETALSAGSTQSNRLVAKGLPSWITNIGNSSENVVATSPGG